MESALLGLLIDTHTGDHIQDKMVITLKMQRNAVICQI